ncbi:NAD(P)/FAD-dependent oxidoreductase [Pseudactinotalea sp. Z1748]|uniref:NAD(P)/FAD-dependent oxidoreductase n=1 Tax=Pseudactinotalea sp. Z1748 TaxID=3413027 RepID=UPI003C7D0FC8
MPARVTVVGAGIAGAATAFALARRGAVVTIIDNGATGQATAAGAGIIAPWGSSSDDPSYDLAAAGAAFYPRLLDQLADAGVTRTDYRRTGALYVHRDPGVLDHAEQRIRPRVAAAGAIAGEVHRLDPGTTRASFPVLAEDLHGILITGGGRVDGRTLQDGMLHGAQRLGAVLVRGHADLQEARERGRPAATVHVDGRPVESDAVVIAAGVWTNHLLGALGLAIPVEPQRGQITHLRLQGVDTSTWPTVHPLSHHYLVAFDAGRVVAGATRETGSGFDPRVTAAGQVQVLEDALGIAPGLADATVIETRVGLRPLPEHLPVVGPLPGYGDVYVASGYGATGLTMGPLLGDALARAILGEPAPELTPWSRPDTPGSREQAPR